METKIAKVWVTTGKKVDVYLKEGKLPWSEFSYRKVLIILILRADLLNIQ